MGAINNKMTGIDEFRFSSEELDLNQIIKALKAENESVLKKKPLFNLEDLYCTDTTTFVIAMIIYYHIKNNEMEEV